MSQEQITQETVPVAETTQTTTEAPVQETQIEQAPTTFKSWKEAIPEDLRIFLIASPNPVFNPSSIVI